jgi:hypothetical protein
VTVRTSVFRRLSNYAHRFNAGIGLFTSSAAPDSAGVWIKAGSGDPDDADECAAGSLYIKLDGGGLGEALWVKYADAYHKIPLGGNFLAAGLLADVIGESTTDAGVTVEGVKFHGKVIDLSGLATNEGAVKLPDNKALAFLIREAANVFMAFVTSDDLERVQLGKLLADPLPVTIDMNDATHTLVLGTAGAAQTKLTSRILFVDPNSGQANEKLKLPPVLSCIGFSLDVYNTGGEDILLRDIGDTTTIITVPAGKAGRVACDGVNWRGMTGA